MWPPSFPKLNHLDFNIWAHIEKEACSVPHANVATLKESFEAPWAAISKDYIKSCCRVLRKLVLLEAHDTMCTRLSEPLDQK